MLDWFWAPSTPDIHTYRNLWVVVNWFSVSIHRNPLDASLENVDHLYKSIYQPLICANHVFESMKPADGKTARTKGQMRKGNGMEKKEINIFFLLKITWILNVGCYVSIRSAETFTNVNKKAMDGKIEKYGKIIAVIFI